MKRLVNDYITKIEGHGTLRLNFSLADVHLEVREGERLFEGLLLGQPASQAIYLTSRICGVCPIVHQLAAAKAIETSMGIKISQTDLALRRLLHANQIISSHLIHLFFLSLPDYACLSSGLAVAKKYPAEFRLVLALKRLVDQVNQLIGQDYIHPKTVVVGGLNTHPAPGQLGQIRDTVENILDEAADFAHLFVNLEYPRLRRRVEMFCLDDGENYSSYDGEVVGSRHSRWLASDYQAQLSEEVRPYATAKFAVRRGQPLAVGALARVSLMSRRLHPQAQEILRHLHQPLANNPFLNNACQAIEIVHFLYQIKDICDRLISDGLEPAKPSAHLGGARRVNEGVGAVEAPRGILYHHYRLDKNNKINYCNIITPTVQNLTGIEEDCRQLIRENRDKDEAELRRLIEMLIRAYDPCLTCSVH